MHNPATAGTRQQAFVGASFKTQWSSIPGSPKTGLVFGQTRFTNAKIGLGGYLYRDVTGPTSRTGLQMAYAYHVPVTENGTLSFGFEARLQQLQFDRAKLQAELGGLDPVATGASNRLKADAGFGMAYTTNNFQVGASVSQLVQSAYHLYETAGNMAEQSKLYRHYYLHGFYNWQVDESTKIIPNALLIYLPNAPLEVQSAARVEHNRLFWYGLGWRQRQGWMISAGVNVKEQLTIGYSYAIYSSPLSVYEKGSAGHELLLRYELR